MQISAPDLQSVHELYRQGLILQAYRLAESLAPLGKWSGTEALLLLGRLVRNLGAPRRSFRCILRARRSDPTHPEARYYHLRNVLDYRGPYEAWTAAREEGPFPAVGPPVEADWLALQACILGKLRDFEAAEEWLCRAEDLAPRDPWIQVERAFLLEMQDRYDEGLAASRRALEHQAWFRPAVQAAAHFLELLGRDGEALELLNQASQRIESSFVLAQKACLEMELGLLEAAETSLTRYGELTPLRENTVATWLAGQQAEAAYLRGDFKAAADFARRAETPFYQAMAERLADPPALVRRVQLPVGFIRQHHLTCGPATLSAVSRYWDMPVDHLEVVGAICYDGTSTHSERDWAEKKGYSVREFTVTWESALALLDRGVPFTLATVQPGNAHLQAIIGYDGRRGTFLIRDPFFRSLNEAVAADLLKVYQGTGPHGMAPVPRAEAARFEGLDLPDSPLNDAHYRLQHALLQHDREQALKELRWMESTAAGHRLSLQAARAIAIYDADPSRILSANRKLAELFPEDGSLQLCLLASLRDMVPVEERIRFLRGLCGKPLAAPIFLMELAREMLPDARLHVEAASLLRRAIRRGHHLSHSLQALGTIRWAQGRREEALELYRFAACLDDKQEWLAREYFTAARHLKQERVVLRFLQDRFQRFGRRSGQPARTLSWALDQLDLAREALAVLEAAAELRPDDGELLLHAADSFARNGRFEQAAGFLFAARRHSRPVAWLQTAAGIAQYLGGFRSALSLWRKVADAEPFNVAAHRAVARLLADSEGAAAAVDHVRAAARRFPSHIPLQELLMAWLRGEDPQVAEAVARQVTELDPSNAWARRERACLLAQLNRFEEALAEMDLAERLEPDNPSTFSVLGDVHARRGDREGARAAFRRAIHLSVDTTFAIAGLLSACATPAQRREAVSYLRGELARQTMFGDGLLSFRLEARNVLEPEELLAVLREAQEARPDLWHAWSALVRQLVQMDQQEEALRIAQQAVDRFPLIPDAWLSLAQVARMRLDREAEVAALEGALRINPSWDTAVQQLSDAYLARGELPKARAMLERAAASHSLSAINHGYLADVLWQSGEKDAALERIERALQLDPGYLWAWDSLRMWSTDLKRAPRVEQFARELTAVRPGDPRAWRALGRILRATPHPDEALAAVGRALEIEPRNVEAHELRASILCEAGRFDEALEACRPPGWEEDLPVDLQLRAAQVEAERGNLEAAVSRARTILEQDPANLTGWKLLAKWHGFLRSADEQLQAARRIVRLAPQESNSHSYLGDASLAAGDRPGAKAAYRRALELAPQYRYVALSLFDLELEDGEVDSASKTLAGQAGSELDPYFAAREVQLACKRGDRKVATRRFRDLCCLEIDGEWPLEAACEALQALVGRSSVVALLEESVHRPEVSPRAVMLWVERLAGGNQWKRLEKAVNAFGDGAAGEAAFSSYLNALGRRGGRRRFRRFLRKHRRRLGESGPLWGMTGCVFLKLGRPRRAVRWLSDWRGRRGVEPWMLLNLAEALRGLLRGTQAREVSNFALTLRPDHGTIYHRKWLALDAALSGEVAPARGVLAERNDSDDLYDRMLSTLLELLVELAAARASGDRRAMRGLLGRWWKARALLRAYRSNPPLRNAFWSCGVRIARSWGLLPGLAARLAARAESFAPRDIWWRNASR